MAVKETVTLAHADAYDGQLTIGTKVYEVKRGVVTVAAAHAEAAMQGGFDNDPATVNAAMGVDEFGVAIPVGEESKADEPGDDETVIGADGEPSKGKGK